MMPGRFVLIIVAIGTLGLFACGDDGGDGGNPNERIGGSEDVYGSAVEAYAILDDADVVTEVGITMPAAAVIAAEGQPAGTLDGWVVDFPVEAQEQTVLNHMFLEFNRDGSGPPWDEPFFFPHYHFLSASERANITCPDDVPIEEDAVPTLYMVTDSGEFPNGGCVSGEGRHLVDLGAPEMQFPPGPFTVSMWMGHYKGDLAFIEPFISTAWMKGDTHRDMEIRQPAVYPSDGSGKLFPTQFTATKDGDLWRIGFTEWQSIP